MATENSVQGLDIRVDQTKTEQFINKYKKQLIGSFIALLVIVGGFFGGHRWMDNRENKAQAQLALGQSYLQELPSIHPDSVATLKKVSETALKGEKGKKDGFKGFLTISKDYKFTEAANLAHLYAGLCYYYAGDYKKAIDEVEDFDSKGDATISANAHKVLGDCYACDKQTDKAIEEYLAAAKQANNASLSPLYLMEAAKIYVQTGKKAEANKLYTQIKTDYPTCNLCLPSVQGEVVNGPQIDKYIESTK